MSIILKDGGWWGERPTQDRVVVTGVSGAVAVTRIRAGQVQKPALDVYEKVGYVAEGSVQLFVLDLQDEAHGQQLPAGSFFRVPPTLIHWFRNRESEDATVIEGLVRASHGHWEEAQEATALAAEWEDAQEFFRVRPCWFADPHQYGLTEADEGQALKHPPSGLVRTPEQVNDFRISHHLKVPLTTKMVCGRGLSIMVAERTGTYHSTPHVHAAEQINAVLKGSNWGYALGPHGKYAAVETREGDIFRFPNLVAHWAWGRDGTGSKVVEFHFPGLHGDPDLAVGVIGLFAADGNLEPNTDTARNIFVDNALIPVAEIENATEATPAT